MAKKKRKKFEKGGKGFRVLADIEEAKAQVLAEKERMAHIERMTCLDLKAWIPGHVSKATAKVYAINKSEVAAIKATKDAGGEYHRGKNAGKANVRVSSNGAQTVAALAFTFKGAKHANWPTFAGGKKELKDLYQKVPGPHGGWIKKPKPYKVRVMTFKKKKALIAAKGKNRVFVMKGAKGLVAMHGRPGGRNNIMPHGSSSIPQAIMNKQVVAIWQPEMREQIIKRLAHHDKQSARGASYLKKLK